MPLENSEGIFYFHKKTSAAFTAEVSICNFQQLLLYNTDSIAGNHQLFVGGNRHYFHF